MEQSSLDFLRNVLTSASSELMNFFARPLVRHVKSDSSIVTEADWPVRD